MKSIVKSIPNTLTCCNLACGFYASIEGLASNYELAMYAVFAAAVFDFLDGLAARLLKAFSPIGKDLDSLADLISFGVAPGMALFSYLDILLYEFEWDVFPAAKLLLLAAFAIPVFSALRLAKFNIDTRQKTSFIGLPVPAHALLWSSLIVVMSGSCGLESELLFTEEMGLASLVSLPVLAVATSLLLVSEIPMFSFKMSSLAWKDAKTVYIQIAVSAILVAFLGVLGISASIIFYIILSLATKKNT
ncbi:MAG: CDP-diacylglycerol--serine O-phosphatidyltransferase [Tannerella sp.]|jgi:CDP-diacylglycerol--serine O-phosphatidyltransferase|nr:CDP-diacylglycerol--serine O-phosphatidyltransferase [Tannerella sp.]